MHRGTGRAMRPADHKHDRARLTRGRPTRRPAIAAAATAVGLAVLLATLFATVPAAREPARGGPRVDMVRVPAGTAVLGSDAAEKEYAYRIGGKAAREHGWFDHEPRRTVRLPAYDMDRAPVTQADYAAFVRATGRRAPSITREAYREQGFLVHPYAAVKPYLWAGGEPPAERRDHPVVLVSQPDARAFCRWRGDRQQRTCRLPREAEWEKAARGPDGRYFPWGDGWDPSRANTYALGPGGTTPVDAHPEGRSPYGLLDMAGNVYEWTASDGRPGEYVLKGCSWDDLGGICRAAARHDRPAGSRHILIGFRCLCEAGE